MNKNNTAIQNKGVWDYIYAVQTFPVSMMPNSGKSTTGSNAVALNGMASVIQNIAIIMII